MNQMIVKHILDVQERILADNPLAEEYNVTDSFSDDAAGTDGSAAGYLVGLSGRVRGNSPEDA